MAITKQDLINSWVDCVVDEMKTVRKLNEYTRAESDGTYNVRSSTPLWGSYWTLRRLTGPLSYKDACAVEVAMDTFLNQYCAALALTDLSTDEDEYSD